MPRLIRSSRLAILATLIASSSALLASADNNAQGKPGPPTPGGASTHVTKEEVAAALGVAVTGPKELNMADTAGPGSSVSSCSYEGSGLQSFSLNVTKLAASSAPMFKAMCAKATRDGLEGLGDLACWYNAKHQELHAFKGTTFFSVELHRSGDTTEAIKGVMKKALDRFK